MEKKHRKMEFRTSNESLAGIIRCTLRYDLKEMVENQGGEEITSDDIYTGPRSSSRMQVYSLPTGHVKVEMNEHKAGEKTIFSSETSYSLNGRVKIASTTETNILEEIKKRIYAEIDQILEVKIE